MVFCAYTFILWHKLTGGLQRWWRIDHSLTAFGETLKPIILQMHQLGIEKNARL
ncbi:hypothetical protein [Microcystis sp. LSC13-02]|uniref:hypothetical protein n=1 Tax=Microcystis sp. LSC13-02 TaxID=1895004 RepID=UPI00257FCE8B|nr:hypothetical protein [Microcystis sp. LSC13-02]